MIIFLIIFSNHQVILSQSCNTATRGITADEKIAIVDAHNAYRNQIALQKNLIGPVLPFATNMQQMYWNEDIAKKAQQWANGCTDQHSTNDWRAQPSFSVGENLYHSWSSVDTSSIDFKHAVDVWFNEITQVTAADVLKYVFNSNTGHFTQIIWAATNQVGCGFSQWAISGKHHTFIVCEYGPAGNIITYPIYKSASTATCACPANYSCGNSKFTGLCCQAGACGNSTPSKSTQTPSSTPTATPTAAPKSSTTQTSSSPPTVTPTAASKGSTTQPATVTVTNQPKTTTITPQPTPAKVVTTTSPSTGPNTPVVTTTTTYYTTVTPVHKPARTGEEGIEMDQSTQADGRNGSASFYSAFLVYFLIVALF
jgi:hypothetical protein